MNILIVEDETLSALFIKEVASKYGYTHIHSVTNANDALSYAQEVKLDLIFMDININGAKDGIQCMQELIQYSKAKCVYISSYRDEETLTSAINTHTIGYLVKPIYEYNIHIMLLLASKHHDSMMKKKHKVIHFATHYHFACENNQLFCEDRIIELTLQELKVFKLLLLDSSSYMTSEHIAHILYASSDTTAVRNLIRRVRQKIPDAIRTIRGVGYCIDEKYEHYV